MSINPEKYLKKEDGSNVLSITGKKFTKDEFGPICAFIGQHDSLDALELDVKIKGGLFSSSQSLDSDYTKELISALKENQSLKRIKLSNIDGANYGSDLISLFDRKSLRSMVVENSNLKAKDDNEIKKISCYRQGFDQGELARICSQNEQPEEAIEGFKKALESYKKVIAIIKEEGLTFENLRDKVYKNLYYNTGVALDELGDPQKAIVCYDKQIKVTPDLCSAYRNAGNIYFDMEEYKKALPYKYAEIDLAPNDPASQLTLFHILFKLGEPKCTIYLKKAYQLVQDNPDIIDQMDDHNQTFVEEMFDCFEHLLEEDQQPASDGIGFVMPDDNVQSLYRTMTVSKKKDSESSDSKFREEFEVFKNSMNSVFYSVIQEKQDLEYIYSKSELFDYYKAFNYTINQYCLTSMSIASGRIVYEQDKGVVSTVFSVLASAAQGTIPGLSAVLGGAGLIADYAEKTKTENTAKKFSALFSNITEANDIFADVARKLAIKKETSINKLYEYADKKPDEGIKGFIKKLKEVYKDAKDSIIYNEYNSPAKVEGLKDASLLIKACISGKDITSNMTPPSIKEALYGVFSDELSKLESNTIGFEAFYDTYYG